MVELRDDGRVLGAGSIRWRPELVRDLGEAGAVVVGHVDLDGRRTALRAWRWSRGEGGLTELDLGPVEPVLSRASATMTLLFSPAQWTTIWLWESFRLACGTEPPFGPVSLAEPSLTRSRVGVGVGLQGGASSAAALAMTSSLQDWQRTKARGISLAVSRREKARVSTRTCYPR